MMRVKEVMGAKTKEFLGRTFEVIVSGKENQASFLFCLSNNLQGFLSY